MCATNKKKSFVLQGQLYSHNFMVDLTKMPTILPLGDYIMKVIIYTMIGNVDNLLYDLSAYFELKSRR